MRHCILALGYFTLSSAEALLSLPAPDLNRIRTLLLAALELPPADRRGFVDREAAEDAAVRAELIELLTLDPLAEGFLECSLPASLGLGQTTRPSLIGARLDDRYDIESVMAESGFATVYLARDTSVARKRVVVKVLDRVAQTEIARRSFQVELEALTAIDHPAVVGVSDTGLTAVGFPYLVLAFVPGVSLREMMATGPLGRDRSVLLLKGLARALAIAHRAGVAHLDVKPENIVISDPGMPEERATLLDFGISRLRSANDGIQAGSLRYMAPEQATNPTASCDVYSLGVIAKEMGGLPLTVRKLLDRRYPSAVEFAAALDEATRPRPWRWVALAAATLTIAGTGFYLTRPPAHFYAAPEPLITSPARDKDPALSADGQWLYFAAGPLNGADLYRQSTAGGSPMPLVLGETNDLLPQPSPDGKAFSFIRRTPLKDDALFLQDLAPGATPKVLVSAPGMDSYSWSPDGRSIVFSYNQIIGQSNSLGRFDLASGAWIPILPAQPDLGFNFPAVSPDGKQVAYARGSARSANIFVMALSNQGQLLGEPRQITALGERIQGVQWTPDSRDLIFRNGPLDNSTLWRVSVDGRVPSRITSISQPASSLAIAANVWKLAYGVDLSDDNVYRLDLTRSGPEALQPVVLGTAADEEASPSPDGKSIVFSSSRTGRQQIWLADHDGKNPRQVTTVSGTDGVGAGWTPDGRDLLINIRSTRGNGIFRTPSAGPFVLTPLLENASLLCFARDGKSLFIARAVDQIWRMPYPALTPAVLLPLPGGRFLSESPDGTIYYSHRHEAEGLFSQPANQSAPAPERVVEHLLRRNLFEAGRQGIFYIAPRVGAKPGLYFLRYGSKVPVLLYPFEHWIGWGMKLSSDEKSLFFTRTDSDNDDIHLIHSFR